jgi:hypothetical protein
MSASAPCTNGCDMSSLVCWEPFINYRIVSRAARASSLRPSRRWAIDDEGPVGRLRPSGGGVLPRRAAVFLFRFEQRVEGVGVPFGAKEGYPNVFSILASSGERAAASRA